MDQEAQLVLKALAESSAPLSGKDVASTSGVDVKEVPKIISKLKKQGLVDSPVRCKYGATEAGKASLA
ncbi:MAG: MarR family transcriptional regulator [Deltaproteobacteria bacterium]|nr:MarR family transcriptional regulator [Deltaproteobacteria bacterium]